MEEKIKNNKNTNWFYLVLTGIAICYGIIIFWAVRKEMLREEVPDYLIGRWYTSAPEYKERYMEISKVSLLFTTSISSMDVYFIDKVTSKVEGKQIFFKFECNNLQKIPIQFSLIYTPGNGETLSFKNQPHITWQKEAP